MRKLVKLAALLSLSLMTACANTTVIDGTVAQVCREWQPIQPSRKDIFTTETARQIAGNNAANQTWCKTKPPATKIAKAAP